QPVGKGLGIASVAYGTMTRYLEVAARDPFRIDIEAGGGSCGASDPLGTKTFTHAELGDARDVSLIIFGHIGEAVHPLDVALLADDLASPQPMRAKARNFATDTEAPTIDVGFLKPDGQRMLIFQGVAYGHTPRGTAFGTVSSRGYVDGIP